MPSQLKGVCDSSHRPTALGFLNMPTTGSAVVTGVIDQSDETLAPEYTFGIPKMLPPGTGLKANEAAAHEFSAYSLACYSMKCVQMKE